MMLQKNFARDSPLSIVPDTKIAAFKSALQAVLQIQTTNRWNRVKPQQSVGVIKSTLVIESTLEGINT
jgi:hypothetical protein